MIGCSSPRDFRGGIPLYGCPPVGSFEIADAVILHHSRGKSKDFRTAHKNFPRENPAGTV